MNPQSQQPQTDTGLARRGLLLLVLVGGICAVVLLIIFKRPEQALPAQTRSPEPFVVALATPNAAFPTSVSWPSLALAAETLPSSPGWEIRYNAAGSLARIGSERTPWETLAEMLDEEQQMRNFRVRLESGKVVPDETAARLTMIAALKAVKAWHEKNKSTPEPGAGVTRVYAAIERLAQSPIVELNKQAEQALAAIAAAKKAAAGT